MKTNIKSTKARGDIEDTVERLIDLLTDSVSTKGEKVPKEEDLSKSKLDKDFNIDIFYSRRPGMRRSIQLISAGVDKDKARVSCMTALCSLADTMVASKEIPITREDIVTTFVTWMEANNISLINTRDKR